MNKDCICKTCANPVKWRCCICCLKLKPDGTINPSKHWDVEKGCDLPRDKRPKICNEHLCEWAVWQSSNV